MAWDVNGICEWCGKPYIKKANHQKYCEACRDEARKENHKLYWQKKGRELEAKRNWAKRRSQAGQPNNDAQNICKRMKTCVYSACLYDTGSTVRYCNYIGIVGHRRGCKPSECTKYKRKTRKGNEK